MTFFVPSDSEAYFDMHQYYESKMQEWVKLGSIFERLLVLT